MSKDEKQKLEQMINAKFDAAERRFEYLIELLKQNTKNKIQN